MPRFLNALSLSHYADILSLVAGGQQEPDLVQVAKSMVRAVPQEERDAVRGVGTLDLDGIMGLLSEVYLIFWRFTF